MPQIGLFDNIWSSRVAPPQQMPMPPPRPPGQMLGMPQMPPQQVAGMMPPQMLPPAAAPQPELQGYDANMEQLKRQLQGQQQAQMLGNMGAGMTNAKPRFGEPPPLPPPLQLPQQPIDMTAIQRLAQPRQFGPMLGFGGGRRA